MVLNEHPCALLILTFFPTFCRNIKVLNHKEVLIWEPKNSGGVGHLQEFREVMRGKMWINMLRQGHLQKLHVTDGEVIQILEQGCYMPPEKGQGNQKIQII